MINKKTATVKDQALRKNYEQKLSSKYNIEFNNLLAITNIPVSRFLDYLVSSENYEEYMTELVNAYNPSAAEGVMCRNTLSVGWDGYLYDCDFNQMLEMPLEHDAIASPHISDLLNTSLEKNPILVADHCFGCTAGQGSSCGGALE